MFIQGKDPQLDVLLLKALPFLQGKLSSCRRIAEVAALLTVCWMAGVCGCRKLTAFKIAGHERKELPSIIWRPALLRLQLRKILPGCLIPRSSILFLFIFFPLPCVFLFHGRALLDSNISITTTWQVECTRLQGNYLPCQKEKAGSREKESIVRKSGRFCIMFALPFKHVV